MKKNILMILTNGFFPDLRVYKEAKHLLSCGHRVEILCWDRDCRFQDGQIEYLDGIKIVRFQEQSVYGTGVKQIFKMLKFKNRCKKYIKTSEVKYDYIHCHDLDGIMIGYLLRKRNQKLIFDMHEFYESGRYQKIASLLRIVIHFLQNRCYKIIHVNNEQLKNMSEKNKAKLVYLPNYPEKSKFKDIEHINSDKLRITYAGYIRHFIPLKNLVLAVGNNENFDISIHGSGDVYEDIKKYEEEYKNLHVTGNYKHEEIVNFYANTDLMYVVYNKGNKNDETALPTKFFEAMICKIPVIVSKNSLMEETVNKYGIGFAVDGTDAENIKEELLKILENKEIIKEKIRNIEKIPEQFVWEEIVKNLDNIYGE